MLVRAARNRSHLGLRFPISHGMVVEPQVNFVWKLSEVPLESCRIDSYRLKMNQPMKIVPHVVMIDENYLSSLRIVLL